MSASAAAAAALDVDVVAVSLLSVADAANALLLLLPLLARRLLCDGTLDDDAALASGADARRRMLSLAALSPSACLPRVRSVALSLPVKVRDSLRIARLAAPAFLVRGETAPPE